MLAKSNRLNIVVFPGERERSVGEIEAGASLFISFRVSTHNAAYAVHGLMTSVPQSSKSLTLRVARLAPRDRAMATIMASSG
jgi:hypothetical protein